MLRLAILYDNRLGRNDGNPLYVLSSLKRRQERGELEVDHLIPEPGLDLKTAGKFEASIIVDWGEDGLRGILGYEPLHIFQRPVVYWASDVHLGYDYRLSRALESDIVFVAQKEAVQRFKDAGVPNPIWLPHAVEPMAYSDIQSYKLVDKTFTPIGIPKPYEFLSKQYDLCFVGHVNSGNRIDALDRMFKEFPNFFYGQRLFNEAAEKYAQSKVVFNIAMKGDVNMRCFEVCGSKSFLLTDWLPDLEELGFIDGKTCATYKSMDEAVEKAKYYIEHNDEREEIAKAGYENVMANHTIDKRVDVMFEEINAHIKGGKELCLQA